MLANFWADEKASAFTLVTGNSEYELAAFVALYLWAGAYTRSHFRST